MSAEILEIRTFNATAIAACRAICPIHQEQCSYDRFHKLPEHRCPLCLEEFFVGLQKSKAAMPYGAFPMNRAAMETNQLWRLFHFDPDFDE